MCYNQKALPAIIYRKVFSHAHTFLGVSMRGIISALKMWVRPARIAYLLHALFFVDYAVYLFEPSAAFTLTFL